MLNMWRIFEEGLRREVVAAKPEDVAELAARHAPTLTRFRGAMDVIRYLHAIEGSDEGRDLLLAELVVASKVRSPAGKLARALLWLALWPGLTAILKRTLSRRYEPADAEEIAATLTEKLALAVSRFDSRRASKTAATLLMNTRRLFWASLRERMAWLALTVPLRREDYGKHTDVGPCHDDVVAAVIDLRRAARSDATLVVSSVMEGESTREGAIRCGVRREAIKKRIQRALHRCRARDDRKRSRVPLFGAAAPIGGKGKKTKHGDEGGAAGTTESVPNATPKLDTPDATPTTTMARIRN